MSLSDRRWLGALRAGVSLMLLARGWLTFRWDSPIRALLWHEGWWSGPLESLTNYRWEDYALHSGPYLDVILKAVGVILMLSAVLPWVVSPRRGAAWLALPFVILLLDATGRWVGSDQQTGMAIEFALQVTSPIALWLALACPQRTRSWLVLVLSATAFTFVGHGLYAAGIYAVPLSYQTMTMDILHLEQETALQLLKVAGWLDFVAALGLILPVARRAILVYMVAWGGLTALARIPPYFDPNLERWGLDPWLMECLVRTPHWLLPLLAYLLLRHRKRQQPRAGGT